MKFLTLFAACFILLQSFGQNAYPYGQFNIVNIDRTEFGGGVQNWDIIQNDDHLFYVANNGGILEFNGERWYKFELENSEHPRSFGKDQEGNIYVGGKNEFGQIRYDEKGLPYAENLSKEIDSLEFGDVWYIHCLAQKTYFVTRRYVFIKDSSGIETIKVPEDFPAIKASEVVGNEILYTFNDQHLSLSYVCKDGKFIKVANSEGVEQAGAISMRGVRYLASRDGVFYALERIGEQFALVLSGLELDYPREYKYKHIQSNGELIVSTIEGVGVQVFDADGNFIRSIGEVDGLNNSIVRKSIFDQYNNLWLCTDNGISFVETSSALTQFGKEQGVTAGVTEDLAFKDDKVILATHSDLFTSKIENGKMSFESTPVFGFETWQIKKFTFPDGKTYTLIIANDGIYILHEDMSKTRVAKNVYAWDLFQSEVDPNRIYIGMDGDGVNSMYYENGEFTHEGHMPGTSGDVRAVVEHNGKVYYCVKYEGIHLLDTTKKQSENRLDGLVTYGEEDQNYEQFTLAKYKDKVYAGTVHGLYVIEDGKLKQAQIEDCRFCEKDLLIHRIINDGNGKCWLVMFHNSGMDSERAEMGYLEEIDGELKWHSYTFNQIKDDVIFSINRDTNGIYWLGGVKAVYTYNEHIKNSFDIPFQVFISGVYLNDNEGEDVYVYNTMYAQKDEHVLSYEDNSIRFQFGCNAYLGGLNNEYSYYLEGEEDEWSKWRSTPQAEYQRLREGKYVLHVKARNFYGFESEEASFAFTITPPWYRTWWAYLIYILLFIALIYVIIRLSIRRVKAQNERLEQIVEERTAEIAEQNTRLEHQKAEIEEKTNDILDSIKYAKRIQSAILPTDETMSHIFDGEHFVFYKPKDIVSGDFYWADRFGSEAIFAAVDCTGHGVPGAFVSIVGFNGLNRTVNEFKLRKPGEILDKLTELVVGTFSKSESQIKDGMDIALCNINYETNVLSYAGANNPLILIRDGELIEYKGNKQPIGEFENRVPFTTHEINLKKGDCIYVFSDGYADQFGGAKGKKFKGKALKNLLLEISTFDMETQHKRLYEAFIQWKGDFEQLDDVCLFGVKI